MAQRSSSDAAVGPEGAGAGAKGIDELANRENWILRPRRSILPSRARAAQGGAADGKGAVLVAGDAAPLIADCTFADNVARVTDTDRCC